MELFIEEMKIRVNHLDQIYTETVEDALEEVEAMVRQVQNTV